MMFSRKFFNGFLPCTTYGFHFERNGQMISHWDDPNSPTKSVYCLVFFTIFFCVHTSRGTLMEIRTVLDLF